MCHLVWFIAPGIPGFTRSWKTCWLRCGTKSGTMLASRHRCGDHDDWMIPCLVLHPTNRKWVSSPQLEVDLPYLSQFFQWGYNPLTIRGMNHQGGTMGYHGGYSGALQVHQKMSQEIEGSRPVELLVFGQRFQKGPRPGR